MPKNQPKVIVVGVDGCSFTILNKLIAKGLLPNFERLIQQGAWGKLRSTVPPASPSAWSTFQTGKDPGKHGIFDFFRNIPELYNYTPVNATFLKEETFWQRLSRFGMRVGVINFLFTYPPAQVNGFVVSGKETPSEEAPYTFPEQLKEEILKVEPDFEVELFKHIAHTKEFLVNVVAKLQTQENVNRHLLENHPTDLFMNMFAMPDILQHKFWHHMDENHPLHDPKEAHIFVPLIESVFQKLDDFVGDRLNNMGPDCTLVVMSDHGFCGLSKIVQINKWLQNHQLQYLRQRRFSRNSIRSFLLHLLRRFDLLVSRYDYLGLRRVLKQRSKEMRKNYSMTNMIDWSRTKAYMGRPSESGIFINVKGREKLGIVEPGEEYESLRDEIVANLKQLTDPETGTPVFKNVYTREELYQGPYVQYAPDVIVETGELPYQEGDNLLARQLFEKLLKGHLSGKHHPDGIFLIAGKEITKGQPLNNIHIRDVAPTILYLLDQKIPVDMDGRVIKELFSNEVRKRRPIQLDHAIIGAADGEELQFDDQESAELEKRLKDLGYL